MVWDADSAFPVASMDAHQGVSGCRNVARAAPVVDATIHPSLTPGAVHGVGLSTSGEYIVTTGADSRLCMWSVHGEMLCELWRPFVYTCVERHARPAQSMHRQRKGADLLRQDVDGLVSCRCLATDGQTVVLGTDSGHVHVWDIVSREVLAEVQGHSGALHVPPARPPARSPARPGTALINHSPPPPCSSRNVHLRQRERLGAGHRCAGWIDCRIQTPGSLARTHALSRLTSPSPQAWAGPNHCIHIHDLAAGRLRPIATQLQ
jgi:WD40 repeat protein